MTTKLHIANTFFEHELNFQAKGNLIEEMRRTEIYLQLQFLPCLYADPSDGVGVSDLPDTSYLDLLKQWKLPSVKLHRLEDSFIPSYDHIESWGASQVIANWAAQHHQSYAIPAWPLVREINSKAFSFEHTPHLRHAALLHDTQEALAWIDSFQGPKILKTCFGLSGTGHFLIEPATPQNRILSFLNRQWQQSLPVIAEPWVDRVLDFSTQWMIQKNHPIAYLGSTVCINDARGKYLASRVGDETSIFGRFLPFLIEHKSVAHALLTHLAALGYVGNIGLDAMVYSDGNELQLHPIVEINARKTMGYASLMLQQKHFPDKILSIRFEAGAKGLLPSSLHLPTGKQVVFRRNLQVEIEKENQ